MKIVIATIKSWNVQNAKKLQERYAFEHEIQIIEKKEDLTLQTLEKINPDFIFFPHWSYIIPKDIFEQYECVVFHMTDLPYGRGGSPLQNLIVQGFKDTKISAIKVTAEVDAGPIYRKEKLELSGSAKEIYKRCSDVIFEKMIPEFLKSNLLPAEQEGEPVYFKRRTAKESQLEEEMSLNQIYDYVRMLDAEGYPNAYIAFGKYKLLFRDAVMQEGRIQAQVEIVEEEK